MANVMQPKVWDAIVVGSGISGGWAAKELTEKGLETLVLEAGPPIDPGRDYVEHLPAWDLPYRGMLSPEDARTRHIQRLCGACEGWASKFFVNDLENPYSFDEDEPFHWIRGRQVGGRSIMWGRQVYRWSDLDFEANAKDGHGIDWPIRYRDIAPWYDHVERFIGVTGAAEGLDHLPDGQFLPPMDLNCVEHHVREQLLDKYGGERLLTIGRAAIITQSHNGRAACHYCGPCHRGCITGSYFSSLSSTLPAARATGRLNLRPYSVVRSLNFDPESGKASSVNIVDGITMQDIEIRGKIIFLCASALESARILLNSADSHFPDGLANSSGQLGRNLMDHIMGGGAVGTIEGWEDQEYFSQRPNGIYLARYRNVTRPHGDFLRGYAYQGGAFRPRWERGLVTPGFGVDFKNSLKEYGPWQMRLYGFGECLPNPDNRVTIDPDKKDRWGIPVLKISCKWRENERAMLNDMRESAAEMLDAAGAKGIVPFLENNAPGLTIHEMGTARMGRDPKTSVLNAYNQCHDVPNVFVTDGACMTSSANQNPSITYMALTARAADYAAKALANGEV
ncbi:MAG TPA: GMC family oxidoreductase [Acidobacteriota bacterium]|nr:GMC family oxidoreductase [Acidobacteriota bacterium]